MSSIEDRVCEKIQGRAEVGKAKYGVTMEREDLGILEWLKHLQEELMDAAVYVERLMNDVEELKRLAHLRDENDLTNICMECGLSDCTC
jgi:hypothetical protein